MSSATWHTKVKYNFYWEYFCKNFSLTFGRTAQDTCSTCENLKTKLRDSLLNDSTKRVAAVEMIVHKRKSQKFYKSIEASSKASKQDGSNILGICFDFMAVFDLPKIPVQDVYYFRQLSVNNLGIYNIADDTMTCSVFHEGVARKTPDDVVSFVIHYIENFVPPSVEEIHLFGDNCGGQNQNPCIYQNFNDVGGIKMFEKN
ncbi:uncharacterized protein TNCV_305421 [Trichonephila clavipes]|nr:uncharacterized protein TNCV_305421 [Trichonephila clavipes]